MKERANKLLIELDDGFQRINRILDQAQAFQETFHYLRIEYWGDGCVRLTKEQYLTIFERIGCLPVLKEVIINYDFSAPPLPVIALVTFFRQQQLQRRSCLRYLSLKKVALVGTNQDFDDLSEALLQSSSTKSSLQRVSLAKCCRRVVALSDGHSDDEVDVIIKMRNDQENGIKTMDVSMDSLVNTLASLPSLQSMHFEKTPTSADSLARLCSSTSMQTLEFWDIPEFNHDETNCIPKALAQNRVLKDLQITSNLDGKAGSSIIGMLQSNTSLERLGLSLNFANYAQPIAEALANNTSLRALHLRIAIGNHDNHAATTTTTTDQRRKETTEKEMMLLLEKEENNPMPILDVLRCGGNTMLKKLHINLSGVEPRMVQKSLNKPITAMLQGNYVLENFSLRANDDFVLLSREAEFCLKLNRAGRFKLLQHNDNPMSLEDWITTFVEEKDDLDVMFYLLTMNPTILARYNSP